MRKFEYKAVPAPATGTKAKGVKSTEERFALSLTEALNGMAAEGWEYVRAETLPCDERKGLTGTQTTYQNLLIFRRFHAPAEGAETAAPLALEPRMISRPIEPEPAPAPRRVSSQPPEEGVPPPLGSARGEE